MIKQSEDEGTTNSSSKEEQQQTIPSKLKLSGAGTTASKEASAADDKAKIDLVSGIKSEVFVV